MSSEKKTKGGLAYPALPWTWCSGRCMHSEVFLSLLLSHVSNLSENAPTDIQGKLDRLWYLYIQSRWQPKQTITHGTHSTALEEFPQGVFSISSLCVLTSAHRNSVSSRSKQFGFLHAWLNLFTLSFVPFNQRILCLSSLASTGMIGTGSPTPWDVLPTVSTGEFCCSSLSCLTSRYQCRKKATHSAEDGQGKGLVLGS